MPGQEFVDPGGWMIGDPAEHVGEPGLRIDALLARRQAVAGRKPVDVALDREDRIDAAHRLDRHGRFTGIGDDEEVAPAVSPARGFGDRTWPPLAIVEVAEPGISVGLED